jgi:hypothetical protein
LFSDAVDTVILGTEERFSYPWDWDSAPSDGVLTHAYYRPRLRLENDYNGDLVLEDARLWIESGRLEGEIILDETSELRIDGGTLAGAIGGSVTLNDGVLELIYVEHDLNQFAGSVLLSEEEIIIGGNATLRSVDLHPVNDRAKVTTIGTLDLTNLTIADGLEWSSTETELEIWRAGTNEPSEEPNEPAEEPNEPTEEPNEPAEEPNEPASEINETEDLSTTEAEEESVKPSGCASVGFLWLAILGFRRQTRK